MGGSNKTFFTGQNATELEGMLKQYQPGTPQYRVIENRLNQARLLEPPKAAPGANVAAAQQAATRTKRRAAGNGRRSTLLGTTDGPTTAPKTLLGGGGY